MKITVNDFITFEFDDATITVEQCIGDGIPWKHMWMLKISGPIRVTRGSKRYDSKWLVLCFDDDFKFQIHEWSPEKPSEPNTVICVVQSWDADFDLLSYTHL
jgi:hypothetical protein